MKHLKPKLLIISMPIILLFNCNEKSNIVEPPSDTSKDTVILQITEGVFTELLFLQDSYTLDEDINFQILIYNRSDSSGFEIEYGYLQAYIWFVYNEKGDSIMYGPLILNPAGFYGNLLIGDSLRFDISWDQRIYSKSKGISDLKTFSSNYYLIAQPLGNDLF